MLREGNIKCFVVKVRKDLALLQRNATLQPPSLIDGVSVERSLPELVPVCNFRYTRHENYATCRFLVGFVQHCAGLRAYSICIATEAALICLSISCFTFPFTQKQVPEIVEVLHSGKHPL